MARWASSIIKCCCSNIWVRPKLVNLRHICEAGNSESLHRRGRDAKPVLLYAAEWDSPHSAREYFEAYRKILQAKWQRCEFTVKSLSRLRRVGDDGSFVVWLSGKRRVERGRLEGRRRNGADCKRQMRVKLHC